MIVITMPFVTIHEDIYKHHACLVYIGVHVLVSW